MFGTKHDCVQFHGNAFDTCASNVLWIMVNQFCFFDKTNPNPNRITVYLSNKKI